MTPSREIRQTRRLKRFISSDKLVEVGQEVSLSVQESRHLKDVIRLKIGDVCLLTDGFGLEARACVRSFLAQGSAVLRIEEFLDSGTHSNLINFHFHVAIPQKGKFDFLVEKLQEIGVEAVYPLETQRTVIKMNQVGRERSLKRWQKIAEQAAKQSGSTKLVHIHRAESITRSLEKIGTDSKTIVFHPAKDGLSFKSWIDEIEEKSNARKEIKNCHLFFGPEGGFSDEEIDGLVSRGATVVFLGDNILKVDTAVLGVAAALKLLIY